jgi:uncharacterized protein (TIGR03032 family)
MINKLTSPLDGTNIIECSASDSFQAWLSQAGGSLAITTYQAGKLALVGWNGQQVTVLLRQFPKPMGLAVQGQRLALATHHEVWIFANAPLLAHDYLENQPGRYDTLYLPRIAYYTGDLNIHDLAFGRDTLWLVNTRFSCLAALSKDFSFVPRGNPLHFPSSTGRPLPFERVGNGGRATQVCHCLGGKRQSRRVATHQSYGWHPD